MKKTEFFQNYGHRLIEVKSKKDEQEYIVER